MVVVTMPVNLSVDDAKDEVSAPVVATFHGVPVVAVMLLVLPVSVSVRVPDTDTKLPNVCANAPVTSVPAVTVTAPPTVIGADALIVRPALAWVMERADAATSTVMVPVPLLLSVLTSSADVGVHRQVTPPLELDQCVMSDQLPVPDAATVIQNNGAEVAGVISAASRKSAASGALIICTAR